MTLMTGKKSVKIAPRIDEESSSMDMDKKKRISLTMSRNEGKRIKSKESTQATNLISKGISH